MNILIVDDEVIIVSLLKKHIDWERLGFDEVFIAYTAIEARRIIGEYRVDIIVCDIEMPQESGLSFLSWIQEHYPRTVRIILTGFPNFQYAQTAVSIGVFRYLLKPVSFEELSEAVQMAVSEIHKHNSEKQISGNTDDFDIKKAEKMFYANLLTGNTLPFSDYISRSAHEAGLSIDELEPKSLVYLSLGTPEVRRKNGGGLLYALGNIAEELFDDLVEIHLWDDVFWVIRSVYEKSVLYETCETFLSKLQGRLQEEISVYYIYHVNLETLSEKARDLRQISVQYRNAGQNIYDVDSLIESIADAEGENALSSWSVVDAVKSYLHAHYMEPVGRKEIEEAVHMNGDYLNRIFKSATGYSLIQYIQYYRILVSKRLMMEHKHTVTEIGALVGFDTPSYFTKIFKKWTDMTPNEYYGSIYQDE